MNLSLKNVEYIWIDGKQPVSQIRSKSRMINL